MIDDLETLLTPREMPPAANRLALMEASTRIVHRRFLLRRVASWGSAIALFAFGGAAGWMLKPTKVDVIERVVVVVPTPAEVPPAIAPQSSTPTPVAMSPGALELKAELSDDPVEVARLYREAGDKYLAEDREYGQAARCYRLHLNAAGEDLRKVSVADTWLLMTMKTAPQ